MYSVQLKSQTNLDIINTKTGYTHLTTLNTRFFHKIFRISKLQIQLLFALSYILFISIEQLE